MDRGKERAVLEVTIDVRVGGWDGWVGSYLRTGGVIFSGIQSLAVVYTTTRGAIEKYGNLAHERVVPKGRVAFPSTIILPSREGIIAAK